MFIAEDEGVEALNIELLWTNTLTLMNNGNTVTMVWEEPQKGDGYKLSRNILEAMEEFRIIRFWIVMETDSRTFKAPMKIVQYKWTVWI